MSSQHDRTMDATAFTAERGWLPRRDTGRILIDGPDATGFLHRMLSNEVRRLLPGQGCLAFLLTAKGKYLADLHLLRADQGFLIDLPRERAALAAETLENYHFAEDLKITDVSAGTAHFELPGPWAAALIARLGAGAIPGRYDGIETALDGISLLVRGDHLSWMGGAVLSACADSAPELESWLRVNAASLGGSELGPGLVEHARILNGVPAWPHEFTEEMVPLEARLYQGLDFRKGCYVGQETIAMMDTRGKPARLLVTLAIEAPALPEEGAKLFAQSDLTRSIGWLTSTTPHEGAVRAMGYVKTDLAAPGGKLSLADGVAVSVLRVCGTGPTS